METLSFLYKSANQRLVSNFASFRCLLTPPPPTHLCLSCPWHMFNYDNWNKWKPLPKDICLRRESLSEPQRERERERESSGNKLTRELFKRNVETFPLRSFVAMLHKAGQRGNNPHDTKSPHKAEWVVSLSLAFMVVQTAFILTRDLRRCVSSIPSTDGPR